MFQVKRKGNGYTISIGTGKTHQAKNLQEVVYGMQHYFQESISGYPFEYHKHIEHNKECNCCPLCRE